MFLLVHKVYLNQLKDKCEFKGWTNMLKGNLAEADQVRLNVPNAQNDTKRSVQIEYAILADKLHTYALNNKWN